MFIDVYQPVIDELNLRHNYNVVNKGEVDSVINIQNVWGGFAGNVLKVADKIASALIVAVLV